MLVEIDISLLTKTSAIGKVYGALEFSFLPRIGESISLSMVTIPDSGFNHLLIVEHIIHEPNSSVLLSLSDIVASSNSAAKSIGEELSQKYGLFFEPYEN